jgi:hypothetical protein
LIDPGCRICHGLGWVCENHPRLVWSKLGCQCGAGIRCECQEDWKEDRPGTPGAVEEAELDEVIVEIIVEETKH